MKPKIMIAIPQYVAPAKTIEDILCLATLIASGHASPSATVQDSVEHYERLEDDCLSCPVSNVCLALIINGG